jgi:hypothetical protein
VLYKIIIINRNLHECEKKKKNNNNKKVFENEMRFYQKKKKNNNNNRFVNYKNATKSQLKQ